MVFAFWYDQCVFWFFNGTEKFISAKCIHGTVYQLCMLYMVDILNQREEKNEKNPNNGKCIGWFSPAHVAMHFSRSGAHR